MQLTSLEELLSRPHQETEWLWEGRLVAGSVSICTAKPKVGKSTIARNLALSVARGDSFLGWKVMKGAVVYLVLEERAEDVAADFRAMGADGSEDILFADHGTVFEAIGILKDRKPLLLVIDPLFRLVRVKDEKGYAELYSAMGPLIDIARETGTHILGLHHSPKSPKSDAIDSPIGSTAIGGAVSTLLVMKRTKSYRTLETVQRVGENLDEMILEFDSATKTLSLGGSPQSAEVEDIEAQIVRFLLLQEEPRTEPEINSAVEGRNEYKRRAIRGLVQDGKIERIGSGKRNDPYRYGKAGTLVPLPMESIGDDKPAVPIMTS